MGGLPWTSISNSWQFISTWVGDRGLIREQKVKAEKERKGIGAQKTAKGTARVNGFALFLVGPVEDLQSKQLVTFLKCGLLQFTLTALGKLY